MLCRYTAYRGADTSAKSIPSSFPDADAVSPQAVSSLAWAVNTGILRGIGEGKQSFLRPSSGATRAQFAEMLFRMMKLLSNQ